MGAVRVLVGELGTKPGPEAFPGQRGPCLTAPTPHAPSPLHPGTIPLTACVESLPQLSRPYSPVCHPYPSSSSGPCPPGIGQESPGCLELSGLCGPGSPCMVVRFLLGDRAARTLPGPTKWGRTHLSKVDWSCCDPLAPTPWPAAGGGRGG